MTVVNTLADNVFKLRITLNDKIILLLTILTPYVFNSSTDSQYNDTEFKKLFIDSDNST